MQGGCAVGVEGSGERLRAHDQARGDKGRSDLQVRFAAKESSREEVKAGTLWWVAENDAVKEPDGKQLKVRAREGAGFGGFWNTDEGAAKSEGVGKYGDGQRDSQGEESGARHGCEKWIGAVTPKGLAEP